MAKLITVSKNEDAWFDADEVVAVLKLSSKPKDAPKDAPEVVGTYVAVQGIQQPFKSDFTPAETAKIINKHKKK